LLSKALSSTRYALINNKLHSIIIIEVHSMSLQCGILCSHWLSIQLYTKLTAAVVVAVLRDAVVAHLNDIHNVTVIRTVAFDTAWLLQLLKLTLILYTLCTTTALIIIRCGLADAHQSRRWQMQCLLLLSGCSTS
jgi:hypothetical protein